MLKKTDVVISGHGRPHCGKHWRELRTEVSERVRDELGSGR